jgi:hypothetical protein
MKINKRLTLIIGTIGAMAAVAGSIIAYFTLTRGIKHQLETQYQVHLDEIGRFHKDVNLSALTLLKSLNEIIDKKTNQDIEERHRLRNDVALALIAEFKAGDFDFKQSRNLELDRLALANWQEYKELLAKNSYSNINILLNYKYALQKFHEEDPQFVEAATSQDNEGMTFGVPPKVPKNDRLLRDLHYSYRQHVNLLKQNMSENNDQISKDNLSKAFCWYSTTTNNPALTQNAFGYDSSGVESERRRCSQQH